MNRLLMTVAATTTLLIASIANASHEYGVYAPPFAWGPSQPIVAHLGRVPYTIKLIPGGNAGTKVVGRVTFFNENGKEETREFTGSIHFVTGNSIAQPVIQLKGIPFGCFVTVKVN